MPERTVTSTEFQTRAGVYIDHAGKAPVVWAEPSTAVVSLVGKTVRPSGSTADDVPVQAMGQGRPTAGS